jgi:hypothetical protein
MPLTIKKKGLEQKQKQKQKQKQSGPIFFGLDVFWCFFSIFWPMEADPDRSQRMLCPGPD